MAEEQSIVKPLFHYSYRNEGVILDQQYNYQGNLLAVSNSLGDILFYLAGDQKNREPIFIYDRKKASEPKYAITKIAWSLPIFSLFATISINREIQLFTCHKSAITPIYSARSEYVPQSLSFCPVQSESLLAVGLSSGTILLLNDQLNQIDSVQAHEEAVTCLAWDHKILSFEKNKWIIDNFSHMQRNIVNEELPQLISGSCDNSIKIWKLQNHKLIELYRLKNAHQKAVRDVQWRNTYLLQVDKFIITCSEDATVKIWRVKWEQNKIIDLELKETTRFEGPVYKANFNFLGNLIAISYCNEKEEKVETIIMREKNGAMMGEQIKIHN